MSLVLNGTLLILFVVFLAYDYRSDSADRLQLKLTALREQARILTPGVRSKRDREELQAYLVETRTQMNEAHADSHLIAAEVNGELLQSGMLSQDDESVVGQLRESTSLDSHILETGGKAFLVGSHRDGATVAYVAEDLQEVRAAIRADLGRHLLAVSISLLFGVGIINGVLWLSFQRPLSTLTAAVGEIGSGNLGLQIKLFGTQEFDILATSVNNMSRELAAAESARVAQMRKARTIQDSLLPAVMTLDGVSIAHHFEPAETVGGDYYDLLTLKDGSGLFCLADVSGHGVSAALVAAMVKICLLNAVEHTCDPGELLGFVDRRLSAMDLPGMFVSMFLVRFRREQHDLEIAGAGHPSALLIDGNGHFRELSSQDPVLGIGADFSGVSHREPFAAGDRLILYTDGVTEASDRDQELFGDARLQELLAASKSLLPSEAVQAIVNRLTEHLAGQPAQDDITFVLIERQRNSE